jgi:hypothetical protein
MPVVLLLAAVAILAGVVVVALGRGGELTPFRADTAPFRREFATAAQVASFRPPPAFFGYSAQVTDDALQRIARSVAARDAELARLRSQVIALRRGALRPGGPGGPGGAGGPARPGGPASTDRSDRSGGPGGRGQPGGFTGGFAGHSGGSAGPAGGSGGAPGGFGGQPRPDPSGQGETAAGEGRP